MNVTRSMLAIVGITALLAACSSSDPLNGTEAIPGNDDNATTTPGDDGTPNGAWQIGTVDTTVVPANLSAGDTASVVCSAKDSEGNDIDVSTTTVSFAVTPSAGVTIEGDDATFTQAGTYAVACTVGEVTDESAATVEVAAGNAATVTEIVIDPSTVAAGEKASVFCTATDASGNAVEANPTILAPGLSNCAANAGETDPCVNQTERWVRYTTVGVYDISCTVPDGESKSAPLTVTVAADKVLELVFTPEADRYDVGQGITITGVLKDSFGNTEPAELVSLQANLVGADPGFDSSDLYNVAGDDTTDIFLFQADGNYEVYGQLVGDSSVEAVRTAHVDSFGPVISLVAPLGAGAEGVIVDGEAISAYDGRGEIVVGDSVVEISGTVSDTPGGLDDEAGLMVYINGVPAPAGIFEVDSEKGTFYGAAVPLVYGINHITVESSDIHGHMSSWTIAILWSSEYYALNPPSVETDAISDALTMHISQELLDDGVHDHTKLDDLATIAEVILDGTDVAKELDPSIAFWNETLELDVFGYTLPFDFAIKPGTFVLDDPKVSMQLGDGTLTVSLEANNVDVGISLVGDTGLEIPLGSLSGTGETEGVISFETLTIASTLVLGIDPATGELTASATSNTLEFDGISGEFDPLTFSYTSDGLATVALDQLGFPAFGSVPVPLDDLNNELIGLFDTVQELEPIVALVAPLLVEYLVPNLLNSVASTVKVDQTLDFPALVDAEGVTGMSMDLDVTLTEVTCTPDYVLLSGSGLVAATDYEPPRTDSPGSIDFNGCEEPQLVTLGDAKAKIGIHDDFFNQLLYGVWAGQLLDFDLDSVGAGQLMESVGDGIPLDLGLAGLNLEPLLPFVFNGCGDELKLQIGDLYVGALLGVLGKESEFGVWINGNIIVSVEANQTFACSGGDADNQDDCEDDGYVWSANSTALGLSVAGYDDLAIDVIVNTGLMEGDDDALKSLLGDQIMPLLFDQVLAEAGNFALPQLDLSTFGESIPEGTALKLNVGEVGHESAYTAIDGGLE
ncbi:MAG: hypothetical protein ACPGU1_02725 [Myxococcota bacterium]